MSTLAATAAEQPAPAPGERDPAGDRRGGGPGRGGFQGPGRGMGMALDEQQRQQFQEALQKQGDKLRELETKLRAAQKDLLEATLASNYDEKAVRGKVEALSAIQTEITLIRAQALSSVAPDLKPEQKQQMIESPFGAMLLNGGPGGGRPPGQGGPAWGGPPGRGGPEGFSPEGRESRPRER